MEKHFSTNGKEQSFGVSRSDRSIMDSQPKPMVVLPHGSPSTPSFGSNDLRVVCAAIATAPLRNSLTELKLRLLSTEIVQRKILLQEPTECAVVGNLFQVKLLQFSFPEIKCTLMTKSSLEPLGILKHVVTLLLGLLRLKETLIPAWMSSEIGDDSSPTWFDSHINPNPIMNVLIWNYRGAMEPKFKTTFLDLVSWHRLAIVVVPETRMVGRKLMLSSKLSLLMEPIVRRLLVLRGEFGCFGIQI
jgi:hypothetical protein